MHFGIPVEKCEISLVDLFVGYGWFGFELLKHFCKFSFYDFHFIISFGLGGLTSMIGMLTNHGTRIAERALMISHLPKLKN